MAKPGTRVKFFRTQAAFRAWLERHHATETELFIGFYNVASGKGGLTYKQALDEALCFGWIDGVRRNRDAESYEQRFTPRKAKSRWSRVNLARVEELKALGQMAPPGVAAWERRHASGYSYESPPAGFSPPLERQLRANPKAHAFFEAQPPGYRRLATFYVMSAKRDETRQTRMARLIDASAQGRRVGVVST